MAAIRRHDELLRLLIFQQPLSAVELREEFYIPKDRLQRSLRQLMSVNIVIRVDFESHTLYAINGSYNTLIQRTLKL